MPNGRNLPISVFDQICLKQTQVFGIFFEIPRELTSAILQPLSSFEFVTLFWGMGMGSEKMTRNQRLDL